MCFVVNRDEFISLFETCSTIRESDFHYGHKGNELTSYSQDKRSLRSIKLKQAKLHRPRSIRSGGQMCCIYVLYLF